MDYQHQNIEIETLSPVSRPSQSSPKIIQENIHELSKQQHHDLETSQNRGNILQQPEEIAQLQDNPSHFIEEESPLQNRKVGKENLQQTSEYCHGSSDIIEVRDQTATKKLGIPNISSDEDEQGQDIFSSYALMGQGYLRHSLPKLQKQINLMNGAKKKETNITIDHKKTPFKKVKQSSTQMTPIEMTGKDQNLLKPSLFSKKYAKIQKKKLSQSNINYPFDYMKKYISSFKRRNTPDEKLEQNGMHTRERRVQNRQIQDSDSHPHQESDEMIYHDDEINENYDRDDNNQDADYTHPKDNHVIKKEKKQNSSPQLKRYKESQINTSSILSQRKKLELNFESRCIEAPITLSRDKQSDLLKYHKKSKNYHGTAKQFGVSHEEARTIIKIHKQEYKNLPN